MKRYEYKALYARVAVAMSAQDFGNWVFQQLNNWGAEGWFITQYQTPTTGTPQRPTLTGELMATGCREVGDGADTPVIDLQIGANIDEHPMG